MGNNILENIKEQNNKINQCVDIVNEYSIDEEIRLNKELKVNEQIRQQNELIRQEQYNNNENKFNKINTDLENITNYTKVIIKEKNNTPSLINSTLNEITNNANSVINFNNVNGVIELEAGIYEVDTVIMRSNITIKGQGIGKTIIKPNFSNIDKYVFEVDGTDTNNRLVNFELKDLSIMPTPEYQYAIREESERYLASVINFSYCSSCRLTNVAISGFKGIAINQVENYDCNLDNLQILGCGDSTHNSITFLNGTSDGCNAIHINGCRFEGNSDLSITCENNRFQREIQIINSKFENSNVVINGTSNVVFSSNHFTQSGITCNRLGTTEKYGIKLIANSFLGINKINCLINDGDGCMEIVGCNFKDITSPVKGGNIILSSCEFYDCSSTVVDITTNCKLISNTFVVCKGDGYLINVTGDKNIIALNSKYFGSITKGCNMNGSNENMILWNTDISFESTTNPLWYAQNNYQSGLGISATHFGVNKIGGLKYDVNEKYLYHYNGDEWCKMPSYQCEKVYPCNTDNPSDIKTILNELITKLVQCGIMK